MRKIEKAIKYLLENKPFYAYFFLNSKIKYDHPQIPTAAAAITPTETVLYFNNEFIKDMAPEEIGGVVEHEVMHLLFNHVLMFNDKENLYNKQIMNIAMDCAINQYIARLPECGITLKGLSDKLGKNLDAFQTWEYYYAELIKQKDKFQNMQTLDVHMSPEGDMVDANGNPIPKDLADAILKATMDKAVKDSAGNVPSEVLKVFNSISKVSQVSWKQLLRNFIAKSTATSFRNTRKRANRRFGLDVPGRLKKRELTLAVCIDTSGSVSDNAYEAFMAEILEISKQTNKTYIISADCVVNDVKEVKKGAKFDMSRKGYGGTAYQPAIEHSKKLGCDAILYFGDMDSADKPEDPNVPFLWVIVGNSNPPADFGNSIKIIE